MANHPTTLTVHAPPPCEVDRRYPARVVSITLNKKGTHFTATLENQHRSMAGRYHQFEFSAAVYPGCQTSNFLTACGLSADTVGAELDLSSALGVVLGIRFSTPDGEGPVTFERLREPTAKPSASKPVNTHSYTEEPSNGNPGTD